MNVTYSHILELLVLILHKNLQANINFFCLSCVSVGVLVLGTDFHWTVVTENETCFSLWDEKMNAVLENKPKPKNFYQSTGVPFIKQISLSQHVQR